MDFDSTCTRSMSQQFAFDSASASAYSAWESTQHQPAFHHIPIASETPSYSGFPQFPIAPVSPASSSSSSSSSFPSMAFSTLSSASPPSSLSEFELLPVPRGRLSSSNLVDVTPAVTARAGCTPWLFDFDFSLGQSHPLNLLHHLPQSLTTPVRAPPTPTSPPSSTPPITPTSPNMTVFSGSLASSPSSNAASSGKRSSSDAPCSTSSGTAKRARACMSIKDFKPPDVTGLSKREARLVKNRAAAFLSRQRKREEFELMEIRVAELEQENARLRDLAEGQSSSSRSSSSDYTEVDHLRAQLAAARQRESELARRLESSQQQRIKTEMYEPMLSEGTSSGASTPVMGAGSPLKNNAILNPKGGASLGLMVLLCALPSLLSRPSQPQSRSTLPTSQSFLENIQWDAPTYFPATTDGAQSGFDWELDWAGSGVSNRVGQNMRMDVDCQDAEGHEEERVWKKLEIEGENENELGMGGLGLGALDISFDTRRTKDGKIRVRVHSSSVAKPEQSTPSIEPSAEGARAVPSPVSDAFAFSPLAFPPQPAPPADDYANGDLLALSLVESDPLGPFLGAGAALFGQQEPAALAFAFAGAPAPRTQRAKEGTRCRVRIALRSLPQPGGEGGEWEVEVR